MLSAALVSLLAMQAPAGAALPDDGSPLIRETWTLEYDISILPYIEDYKRCLNYGNRIAGGRADFEAQHRTDLPRCADVAEESIEAAAKALARRGLTAQYPPEQVADTFYRLGQIHVERGRFIDDRFKQRRAVLAQYRASQSRPAAPFDQTQENDTPNASNQ